MNNPLQNDRNFITFSRPNILPNFAGCLNSKFYKIRSRRATESPRKQNVLKALQKKCSFFAKMVNNLKKLFRR